MTTPGYERIDDDRGHRLTKAQKVAKAELAHNLEDWRLEMRYLLNRSYLIPDEWKRIEKKFPCSKREKMTIRVDSEVARFYRAMGTGYGARMNEVLRAWMLARKAMVIEGPYDRDWLDDPM